MKISSSQIGSFQDTLLKNVMPGIENVLRDLLAIHPDDFIEWIRDNFYPEDIFSSKALDIWAEENGYTREVP